MTSQEKKEYLRQYLELKKECDVLCNEIEQLHAEYTSAKAIQYDDMPKAHNTEHDLSDLVADMESRREEFYKSLHHCIDIRAQIRACINSLSSAQERRVLLLRYIYGLRWGSIASEMGYEERQIYRIHGSALANMSVNVSSHL